LDPGQSLRVSQRTPVEELEQALGKERADLAAVEAKLAEVKKRLELEAGRPGVARERLLAAQQELGQVADELTALTDADLAPAVKEARRWALEARALALSAETRKLDAELLSQRERLELLEMQRERESWAVGFVSARVERLEKELGGRRRAEAEEAQQEAEAVRLELEGKHPLIRELAERNAELGEQLNSLTAALDDVAAEDVAIRRRATRVDDDYRAARKKLAVAGLSTALGRVLLEQRRALPAVPAMRAQIHRREELIADVALRQFEWDEERKALRDQDRYVAALLADVPEPEARSIEPELQELAGNRRELVRKATDTGRSYLLALGELDVAQRQLMDAVQRFDDFLARRLLWMRSIEPVRPAMLASVPAELRIMFSPAAWSQLGRDLSSSLDQSPLRTLLMAALALLALLRRRFLRIVGTLSRQVGRIRTDHFVLTLKALAHTVFAAAPLPGVLFTAGWTMTASAVATPFSVAAAEVLMVVAIDLLAFRIILDICTEDGVAERHFRWSSETLRKLRRELGWLIVVLPLARFIGGTSYLLTPGSQTSGLAVVAILTALGALGVFLFRIFSPRGGVLRPWLESEPQSLLARTRPLWFGLVVALVPVCILLWVSGYVYTARTLAENLMRSLWLVFALILVQALIVRWLLLLRRRIRYQAAIQRLEAARAAHDADTDASGPEPEQDAVEGLPEFAEQEIDLATLGADSRRLLNASLVFAGGVGLWLIWSRVLPALRILENVDLWSRSVVVDGEPVHTPVTLADLTVAVLVLVATVVAARGLPSLVEFVLLRRLHIAPGMRYTVSTLLRYTLIGTGIAVVFSTLGGSWSNIQWLVAALGVGIGFGLQEIVANFVSGLIILFERPIRVGDTVTVGDTTGVVSRIEIRATTIVNFDRQELVVPNREFITGRLLNWSLSDPITRIVVPVGIAYGSDVATAMVLIKEAAKEHENVLDDPSPFVIFEGFGDNSLNLVLRAYLPTTEHRLRTISDLHVSINAKLNEAGIVIAFPQRDVHLDTQGPLDVRVLPPGDEGEPV
ncbi:MAG: mechanosensitive ion channel domain-containing protein, partial [Gammaproteobacteria bacterium]